MLAGKKKKFATLVADAIDSGHKYVLYEFAIQAGYSEKTARQTASRLMKDKDIVKYLEKRKKDTGYDQHTVEGVFIEADKKINHQPVSRLELCDFGKQDQNDKIEACDLPTMPDATNEDYAVTILRVQLHSDDERISQGAAKALLDYEIKKRASAGVKAAKEQNAKQAAQASRFKPRAV